MFVICSICGESLEQTPSPGWSSKILTIRCGHVYHHMCISDFWKKQQLGQSTRVPHACPTCKKVSVQPEAFEIFFSTVDQDDEVSTAEPDPGELESLQRIHDTNEDRLKKLNEELALLKKQLADLHLNDKSSEYDDT